MDIEGPLGSFQTVTKKLVGYGADTRCPVTAATRFVSLLLYKACILIEVAYGTEKKI
jgi:hypothetical protein